MNVIYIASVIMLFVIFILRKKTDKELDIVGFVGISIVLLFCYNTLICYILTFFTIPIKLWLLAIINFIVALAIGIPIITKKQIQRYIFNKIDIFYIILIAIILLVIVYKNFGYPFEVNYISSDPSIHYLVPMRFAEQETLMPNSENDMVYGKLTTFKPNSYVNSGLLMKCFCENLDTIECYNVFVGFSIFTLFMIGVVIYCALKKYAKRKEHIFWAFLVATICTIGYPLNSFLYGFEYLTMGLLIVSAILNLIFYYENQIFKSSYMIAIFGLLNFGLFLSYYMFVPFVYSSLWIYFCVKNYERTKKIITKDLIILLILTLILPFILGFAYTLAPDIYAIFINKSINTDAIMNTSSTTLNSSFSINGLIYINLYSNIILLIPLTIYLFVKDKSNKNEFLYLITCFAIMYIGILFVGNLIGKVSVYYMTKNYFALWIILAFTNYKALILISEKKTRIWWSRMFIYGYILLMIVYLLFSFVKIRESTKNEDENLLSVFEVFGANKTLLFHKTSEYNKKELEIIRYANNNLDFNTNIEIITDHRAYYWSYVLLRYTDNDEIYIGGTCRRNKFITNKMVKFRK